METFRRFIVSLVVLISAVSLIVWYTGKESVQSDGPVDTWATHISTRFQADMRYPAHWTNPNIQDRDSLAGSNGFLYLSAAPSDISIYRAAQAQVEERRKPYGSNAAIRQRVVDGEEALVVFPSEDQPSREHGRAMAVIRYPKSVVFRDEHYGFIVLWADKEHIDLILDTFRFRRTGAESVGTLIGTVELNDYCPPDITEECTIPKDAYRKRTIVIKDVTGFAEIDQIPIDDDGHFKKDMLPGSYQLDINYLGLDRSADVPKRIEIDPGVTLRVNINITTGIR